MKHINKQVIGITGGIGTGKSTVSNILREDGFKVIDADKISKELMKKGNVSYKKVLNYFGNEILDQSGHIDRGTLGSIVFNNSRLLKKLNNLTHPNIFMEIKKQVRNSNEKIIFVEIPLLFEEYDKIIEAGIEFDKICLVFADEKTQINRIMERDNLTKDEAITRIESQMPVSEKKEMSHIVIENTGSKEELKNKVNSLLEKLH